jgi:hypothetical protein
VSEEEGLQSQLGGFEIPERIFSGAREITDRLVLDLRDIYGREVTGSQESSELYGILAVGLDPLAGFPGDEGRCGDEAGIALPFQVAVEVVSAWAGFIGEDELRCLGPEPADELVDVRCAGTDRADIGGLRLRFIGNVSDRDLLLVHIETNE